MVAGAVFGDVGGSPLLLRQLPSIVQCKSLFICDEDQL